MTDKIRAVIFDVGGVLAKIKGPLKEIGHHPMGFSKYVVNKLGINLKTWVDVVEEYHIKASIGGESKRETLKKLAKGFDVSPGELGRLLEKAFKKTFNENGRLYRFAFKLKQKGYKIAILSDQWKLSKECCMISDRTKKFNVSVVSCDVGLKKPDPRIYKLTLKKLGLKAEECVFIDNKMENIRAARKLGMKGILFKNNRQLIKDLGKLGVGVERGGNL
jgi:putative hydrolase of the HAD superfamily